MWKLLAERFIWDAKFPAELQDTFMPFFMQARNDIVQSLNVKNATALFNSAFCLHLGTSSGVILHLLVILAHSSSIH